MSGIRTMHNKTNQQSRSVPRKSLCSSKQHGSYKSWWQKTRWGHNPTHQRDLQGRGAEQTIYQQPNRDQTRRKQSNHDDIKLKWSNVVFPWIRKFWDAAQKKQQETCPTQVINPSMVVEKQGRSIGSLVLYCMKEGEKIEEPYFRPFLIGIV